jgi:peptidoglycan hydrolase-like protein with peptidoglycan-binding domain
VPDPCLSGILKFNAKGPEVTGLQKLLKSKGFDVRLTGKFDTQTKKAVESFQKQQNMLMDGKINPETLGKLLGTTETGSTR